MWNTVIVNGSESTVISVNGSSIPSGQTQTFSYSSTGITINVPNIGTIHLSEPESDYKQHVPNPEKWTSSWALKVTVGDYVGYWGYEGEDTITITIGWSGRFFSVTPLKDQDSFMTNIPIYTPLALSPTADLNLANLEALVVNSDNYKNAIINKALEFFKNSPSVKNIFGTPGVVQDFTQLLNNDQPLADVIDNIAAALVCSSIYRTSSPTWNFSQAINGPAALNYWQTALSSDNQILALNVTLCNWAFPTQCNMLADGSASTHALQDYIKNQTLPGSVATSTIDWASNLAVKVTSNQFINTTIPKLSSSWDSTSSSSVTTYQVLLSIIYKLYFLDLSTVNFVLGVWKKAGLIDNSIYGGRATVDNINYLAPSPTTFKEDMFLSEVLNSINQCMDALNQNNIRVRQSKEPWLPLQNPAPEYMMDFLNRKATALNLVSGIIPNVLPPYNDARLPRTLLSAQKKAVNENPALASLQYIYTIKVFHTESLLYNDAQILSQLVIDNNKVSLDGQSIQNPVFNHTLRTLSWAQQKAGKFTSGSLSFTKDYRAFGGKIYIGTNQHNAVAHEVNGVTPPSIYTSTMGDDSSAVPGPKIQLSYQLNPGKSLPEIKIQLQPVDSTDWQDVTNLFTPSTTGPNDDLKLEITSTMILTMAEYADICGGNLWPACGSIIFSWDGNSFQGHYLPNDPKYTTPEEYLTALATHPLSWNGKIELQNTHAVNMVTAADIPATALDGLSIAELVSLVPQGNALQNNAWEIMVANMQWAMSLMGNSWLQDFFAETPPLLTPDRQTVVNQDLDFYQNFFAPLYIGYKVGNYTGPGAATTPLSAVENQKVNIGLKAVLARQQGYNRQSNCISMAAWIEAVPRLNDYINDVPGAWAQQLYDAITTSQQINLMQARIVSGDSSLLNRYSTILSILDPTTKLARQYYSINIITSLHATTNSLVFDSTDQIMRWLPDFIQAYINQYITLPENPTAAQLTQHEVAITLQKAIQAAEDINSLCRSIADVIVMVSGKSGTFQKAEAAAEAFATKYPTLSALLGRSFKFIMYAGAIYLAIVGFQNWDNLSPQDKGTLITTVVAFSAELISAVPEVVQSGRLSIEAFVRFVNKCNDRDAALLFDTGLSRIDAKWIQSGAPNVGKDLSFWAELVGGEQRLLLITKWFGVAVSAAFAAFSTWTFAEDLEHGASTEQEAFDGIIAASALISTIVLGVDATLTSMDIALAGLAELGPIFAILGGIFALVELFVIHPQPPESPIDAFMGDTLRPLLERLLAIQPITTFVSAVDIDGGSRINLNLQVIWNYVKNQSPTFTIKLANATSDWQDITSYLGLSCDSQGNLQKITINDTASMVELGKKFGAPWPVSGELNLTLAADSSSTFQGNCKLFDASVTDYSQATSHSWSGHDQTSKSSSSLSKPNSMVHHAHHYHARRALLSMSHFKPQMDDDHTEQRSNKLHARR